MHFSGVFPVAVTPFERDGKVDRASITSLVDFLLSAGVHGMVVLGMPGDEAHLSESEREAVQVAYHEDVAGKVPIIAGVASVSIPLTVERSRQAAALGAAALLVAPDSRHGGNDEDVYRLFAEVAAAVDLPIVIQDFPQVNGVVLSPQLLARIVRDIPSARTIKLEDAPTLLKLPQLLEDVDTTPVTVLGGLGGLYFLEELEEGTSGLVTGFAYPDALCAIYNQFRTGDLSRARETFYRTLPIMRFEFQGGLTVALRKELLRQRGAIRTATAPNAPVLNSGLTRALDHLEAWAERNVAMRRA